MTKVSFAFCLCFFISVDSELFKVDESNNYFVKDFTMNVFKSARKFNYNINSMGFWVSSSFISNMLKISEKI